MKIISLAYESYGEENSEPLIILHGFFASSRNWRQMAKRLATHFHVYVPDLRNHGNSPHCPEMGYPEMVEDLRHFMSEHQLLTSHIIGHSMGGKVAMWWALNYPDQVRCLMVADISPVRYQHDFEQTIQALQHLPLEKIDNRRQADHYLAPAIDRLAYRQFLLQNLQLKDGKYCWRVDLAIFERAAPKIVSFPEINNQTFLGNSLFIMGEKSNFTRQEAINHYFPTAKITQLTGASHWLHIDAADAFYAEVVNFIKLNRE